MKKTLVLLALLATFILCLTACNHKHSFGEWEVTKSPTCSADGTKVRYCDCGEKQTESVPSVGHSVVIDKAVEPTCEGVGLTEGKHCDICYKILVPQNEIQPLGHTEVVDKAVAPTCVTSGLTEGKHCKVCNNILVEQNIIDPDGHNEVIDAKIESTCTATGLTEGKHCSVCSETIIAQAEIAKKSHTYDNEYDESCNVCGFIRDAKCAHSDLTIRPAQSPTCTEPGWTQGKVCVKCDEIIVAQTQIPAIGHSEKKIVESNATCTDNGIEKTVCIVCDTVIKVITLPATGHSFSDKWMYDDTYHWHGAICGHNDEVSNKIMHNLDASGKCIVCDYQEQIKLDAPIITTIEYDKVYWSPVANASNYTITVNSDYTYTTANCSADIANATYNGSCITSGGEVNITVQANGSGRYATSDKSTIHNYYYVPEKKDLSSDEAKLYNYGIGYGYNLVDYEAIDAEMISQIRVLNINKLLTLGEFYNPAITTGTVEASHFSSIDELNLHISGSYNRSSGLSIPAIGGIKNQFKIGLGVDYSKYDYNQTYKVEEDFIYKTYGIKDYTYDELKHCLTEAFVNDIKLAESMNEDAWLDYMYSKYGTHVILGVATGASYSATYTISTNKKDIAAQIDFEFERGLGLAFSDILSSDLGVGISLNGKADWSNEDTEAHFKIDWKGSTSGGTTTPSNLDSAIRSFESNINESNAVTIRFTTEGAISIGSLVAMVDASLGEKFESYVNDKGDEEFQKLYSQYTKPSTLPVSINIENGENVLKIDLSSYQNSGSLDNAYNANLLDGIFSVYPKMLGKRVDKIIIKGAFDEYNEKLIDNFSIKLAQGWNKDITVVVENLGVICASDNGIIDSSDVSSIYDISAEYLGVNAIKNQSGNTIFCVSINENKFVFELSIRNDEIIDFTTTNASNNIRLPLPTKSEYVFCGWYDNKNSQVTDEKGYILSTYTYDEGIVTLNARYISHSQGLKFISNSDGSYYVSGVGTCTDTTIVIPKQYNNIPVKGIDRFAFDGCSNIASIVIPDSVVSIDSRAFNGCNSLTSIKIDTNNPSYKDIDGNVYNKDATTLIRYAIGKADKSFIIPSSVTHISTSAFFMSCNLERIVIPDSVISISDNAFSDCPSLASVVIPDSVTSIGSYAFDGCSSLTSVEFAENSKLTSIGALAFYGCSNLTSIEIPDSVETIGYNAFTNCSNLRKVTLGESIKAVGSNLFLGCDNLVYNEYDNAYYIGNDSNPYLVLIRIKDKSVMSFNINPNTKIIYYSAFYNCSNLRSIIIPDSVTDIGNSAFENCSNLTSIVIPDSVIGVRVDSFEGCSNLKNVYYTGTAAEWAKIAYDPLGNSCFKNVTVYYNYVFGN